MKKLPESIICLMLFAACVYVYQANELLTLFSNDNVPNTLLAFNWLENQTLNFDNFRNSYLVPKGDLPYFLSAAPNGHLTSTYPIGTAIVSFPFYLIFFIYLKFVGLIDYLRGNGAALTLNITDKAFNQTRLFFGKLAGTLCSALSVVLFYLSLRLKFSRSTALLTTFIYAFATTTWALNSQDIRQHTASNLVLTALILCLLKVARTSGRQRKILLLIAGCFCGLLPTVRLTSAVFALAAIVYVIYTYRKTAVYLLLGLPSILLNWIWNSYYFGIQNFSRGGYLQQFESGASSYHFSIDYFTTAFWGQLISPSDGLFIYSPVLLLAIPGFYRVFRQRSGTDEKLVLCLVFASLVLFLHYCFYDPWNGGGGSYGPRFLTDIVPVLCFLVGYTLDCISIRVFSQRLLRSVFGVLLLTLIWSTAVEAIGAFSDTTWSKGPIPIIAAPQRQWRLTDTQIERHLRNVWARIQPPIADRAPYLQQLQGQLETLEIVREDGTAEPINDRLIVRVGRKQETRRILRATLKNTGQSPWFGYQTGLENQGETRLRIQLNRATGQPVKLKQNQLYIAGSPQTGATTTAIGQISVPKQPGDYEATIWLFSEGLKQPNLQQLGTFTLTVESKRAKPPNPSSS